ncbi:nuclear transport factor 2 family protein [Amycolatopsis pigmentata]|uniref:Nuclear transport factor 2 family protein n=1 Tax=Amycolatopsis pigmentata TaxID=450801 RepID=A0ABW5FNW9_9PSEU
MSTTTSELLDRISRLEHRLGTLEAAHAVERLHHQYGYYLDKCFYDEVVDLFTDDDPSVYFLHGLFNGKDGVRRLYAGRFAKRFTEAVNGPSYGRLLDHPQMQPVITVAPDLLSANGRFRSIMQAGSHQTLKSPRQWWEGGVYENTYVREGDVWKIKVLNWRPVWRAEFDEGWMRANPDYDGYLSTPYPKDPYGPDEIVGDWRMFPETETVPFHYPHPVTGKAVGA